MKVIALHALIIFFWEKGFDHSIIDNIFFYTENYFYITFYANGEFCRFSLEI